MKEKILTLLREMRNDSKAVSHKAEKELCKILTDIINKLNEIEEKVGYYERDYPDKIESIDNEYYSYDELPEEIYCNNYNFYFKTEWLDTNLNEYFEELKKNKINAIKNIIFYTEYSLSERRRDLQHIEELKFEDLEIWKIL